MIKKEGTEQKNINFEENDEEMMIVCEICMSEVSIKQIEGHLIEHEVAEQQREEQHT